VRAFVSGCRIGISQFVSCRFQETFLGGLLNFIQSIEHHRHSWEEGERKDAKRRKNSEPEREREGGEREDAKRRDNAEKESVQREGMRFRCTAWATHTNHPQPPALLPS
jgi:hypothetical protein